MSKHTPGPWQVVPADKAQSPWIVGDAEGGSIADCEPSGPWMPPAEATANANLIAAAPKLLDAAHHARIELGAWVQRGAGPSTRRAFDAIVAAIAEAEKP